MHPLFVSLAAILLLSGCAAGMEDDFSCGEVDGVKRCVSMTELNTLVDDGHYRTDNDGNVTVSTPKSQVASSLSIPIQPPPTPVPDILHPPITTIVTPTVSLVAKAAASAPTSGWPRRQREDIREITIFPYIDKVGNYHDTSLIYTVLDTAKWVELSNSAIRNSVN